MIFRETKLKGAFVVDIEPRGRLLPHDNVQ